MLQAVAKRPATLRAVATISRTFYGDWSEELAAVKKEFETAGSCLPTSLYFPSNVALAHQILSMRRRLSILLDEHKVQ